MMAPGIPVPRIIPRATHATPFTSVVSLRHTAQLTAEQTSSRWVPPFHMSPLKQGVFSGRVTEEEVRDLTCLAGLQMGRVMWQRVHTGGL